MSFSLTTSVLLVKLFSCRTLTLLFSGICCICTYIRSVSCSCVDYWRVWTDDQYAWYYYCLPGTLENISPSDYCRIGNTGPFYTQFNYLEIHTCLHLDRGQQLTSISIFKCITALYRELDRKTNKQTITKTTVEPENHEKTCQQAASLTNTSRQEQLSLLTMQCYNTTPVTHI